MAADILTIKVALAKLTNSELNALVWATKNYPQVTPDLLAWLETACNWELHRRVGVYYELQSPEAVIQPRASAASIYAAMAIKSMFGRGAGGVCTLLDALIELLRSQAID